MAAASRCRHRRRPRRHHAHTYEGKKPYVEARAATRRDIARIVGDYARAARNAIAAGFDGIQVHGANGYLVDQFLRAAANHRDDEYGGPIDNRLRFMTKVLEAIGAAIGMDRVGIRFSPNILSQGVVDPDPIALYHGGRQAARRRWACRGSKCASRVRTRPSAAAPTEPVSPAMRAHYSGVIALNSDYVGASAQARLDEGVVDAIAFGRPFLANPDLVERISAARRAQRARRQDLLHARARRLCRLSDARRTSAKPPSLADLPEIGRGGAEAGGDIDQCERRLGRAAALVGLARVGADDRLRFILDGQDAVADGKAVKASGPSAPRALSLATISK